MEVVGISLMIFRVSAKPPSPLPSINHISGLKGVSF